MYRQVYKAESSVTEGHIQISGQMYLCAEYKNRDFKYWPILMYIRFWGIRYNIHAIISANIGADIANLADMWLILMADTYDIDTKYHWPKSNTDYKILNHDKNIFFSNILM